MLKTFSIFKCLLIIIIEPFSLQRQPLLFYNIFYGWLVATKGSNVVLIKDKKGLKNLI